MTWQQRQNINLLWKGAVELGSVVSEEYVTNHATNSNDPSIGWTAIINGGAKIQNAALAPNGLMEATEFFGDEGGGLGGQVRHAEGFSETFIEDGQLYRYSIYVKNVQGDDWILLSNSSFTGGIDRGVNYFNVVTGVAGTIAPTGVSGIEAASVTYPDAPAGWWRIWGHMRGQGDVLGNVDLYQRTGDSHPTGNRDNNSYYAWGFMFEPIDDANIGTPSALVETGATAPFTERRITYGTPATPVSTNNSAGYSHTLEDWFSVANITVLDSQAVVNGVPLAKLTDDATDGFHIVGQVNQYVADATRRRLSIYVKQGTARYCVFTDRSPSVANTQWSNIFDMETGTWTFQGTLYFTPFPLEYEAVQYNTGEWRISFLSAVASGAYDNIYIGFSNGPDKEDQSYIGSGSEFYAGGAQIEYDTTEKMKPLVRHEAAGTSGGQAVDSFFWDTLSVHKGALNPGEFDNAFGLENLELSIPTGLNNQEMNIRLVGSTILKIDEFNSSQVIVDREFAVKTELYNSNTTIKVAD